MYLKCASFWATCFAFDMYQPIVDHQPIKTIEKYMYMYITCNAQNWYTMYAVVKN